MGLLEKGANVDVAGENTWTPLHCAAYRGNTEEVNILLKKGVDVSVVSGSGLAPLLLAVLNGHAEVVSALLERVANAVAVEHYGQTYLHIAAQRGHENVASLLLTKGAHVNAKDRSRRTALHLAADKEHVGVVEVLLRMGADVHAVDNEGKTVLCYAEACNNAQLKKILKDFSSQQKPVMLEEAETGQSSCLLKQGEGLKVLDTLNAEEVNLIEKKGQHLEVVDVAGKERQIVFDVTAKEENEEAEKFLADTLFPLWINWGYFNSGETLTQSQALQEEEFECLDSLLKFSLMRTTDLSQSSFSDGISQVQELYFCDDHFVVRPLEYGEQVEDFIESGEEEFVWVGSSKPGY